MVELIVIILGLLLLCANQPPQRERRPTLDRGKSRLLDELADAIRPMQPPNRANRIVRSTDLGEQFHPAVCPLTWEKLAERLHVALPKLIPADHGRWQFPPEMKTVFDLAD